MLQVYGKLTPVHAALAPYVLWRTIWHQSNQTKVLYITRGLPIYRHNAWSDWLAVVNICFIIMMIESHMLYIPTV